MLKAKKNYNRWLNNTGIPSAQVLPIRLPKETFSFGTDEYLKVLACIAECLSHKGHYTEAIKKFESVKHKILSEVVFDKPILLINILCQMGNCHLKLDSLRQARTLYTEALGLVQKLEFTSERVKPDLVSTIYLNMAAISSKEGKI